MKKKEIQIMNNLNQVDLQIVQAKLQDIQNADVSPP